MLSATPATAKPAHMVHEDHIDPLPLLAISRGKCARGNVRRSRSIHGRRNTAITHSSTQKMVKTNVLQIATGPAQSRNTRESYSVALPLKKPRNTVGSAGVIQLSM